MKRSTIGLALAALAVFAAPAAAQSATYTIFSTGTDSTYSGSFDGAARLPFGIDASGYFDHDDAVAREDVRLVASRDVYRGVLAVYEFRDDRATGAPDRVGVGYRAPFVDVVVFPYAVSFENGRVDDGTTVQVGGRRAVGDWRVRGAVDVTRRDGEMRYWGTATAALAVAPRTSLVVEYRARPGDEGTRRSVWFGLGVDVARE